MADKGYVQALLASLPAQERSVLVRTFDYVLGNLRFGVRDNQVRAENFQLYRFDATTSSAPNVEFSVLHGLNQTPTLVIPVLPLDVVGAKYVRLEVTRAADSNRIYLRSPEVNAPVTLLVEV